MEKPCMRTLLTDTYHICLGATGAIWATYALHANELTLTFEGLITFTLIATFLYGAVRLQKGY